MVEVPKNNSKSAFLETLVVTGLFMSAFYFLFFEEIDGVLKKAGLRKDEQPEKEGDANSTAPPPRPNINTEEYEGRSEYCLNPNDPDTCVRGFPMPDSIEDLVFADNGFIRIVTKPNTNPFGLPSRAMVSLYRSGDNLAYFGRIDGVKDKYYENYNDIKDEIVLVKNIYLKTT